MKKSYVPVTLNSYLNESKSITLKRKYGNRQPVVVGANAPLRNQVLAFVSESKKVTKTELKKFIAGLNESSKNPIAAATMWLKRNEKFFITENRGGVTNLKLSTVGRRLANSLLESDEYSIKSRIDENKPSGEYDFVDRKKGYPRPGITDEEDVDEGCGKRNNESSDEKEELDESTKSRIKAIIENIKSKNSSKLNEEDEEDMSDDELTFDDLDLGGEEEGEAGEEGEEEDLVPDEDDLEGGEDLEGEEGMEDDLEGGEDLEDDEEKVEITEFVITVENVEDAISELSKLDVAAEQVTDEEGEAIEDQIKVDAEDWDALKGWLEEKGVDIEEMFGGEIEVEGEEEELEGEEFSLDGEEEDELVSDDDLEGDDELEDLEGDDELEGSEDLNPDEDDELE